ncbi:MAG: hypothetical protein N3A65_09960, partial [candidate division WOR-3 bacterium]|nr:hypothetical protein [candidate division WOR-3 bacterium]
MPYFTFFTAVVLISAESMSVIPAGSPAVNIEQVQAVELTEKVECAYTGVSATPPWLLYRDPPWSASVQVPDVYNRDDRLLSMAQDARGRIYVVYETPHSLSPLLYGWGIATSTDNGLTWDNRVRFVSGYTMRYPEISITIDGKIYIFGTLAGGTIDSTV